MLRCFCPVPNSASAFRLEGPWAALAANGSNCLGIVSVNNGVHRQEHEAVNRIDLVLFEEIDERPDRQQLIPDERLSRIRAIREGVPKTRDP